MEKHEEKKSSSLTAAAAAATAVFLHLTSLRNDCAIFYLLRDLI
jgi:hypothetical protein